ncbi:MAG: hypothetical protein IJ139_07585 [Bacteroidaceae bacterium]|nr:hypothetical protein [Bacteroidaceae bacterium]
MNKTLIIAILLHIPTWQSGIMAIVPERQDSVMRSAGATTLAKQKEHADGTRSFFAETYQNPAMQSGRYTTSLNRIGLNYIGRHATTPTRLEYGNRTNLFEVRIDAYIRKNKTTLWGHARYDNGKTKGIRYNETSDFDLLYPYVIADTVGGDNQTSTYDFLGGFAQAIGRCVVGAEGQYQAQMDYRTRDPRPKNLTGDLKVKVGASYNIGTYIAAASAGFRRYKQTNIVKTYSEISSPIFYHTTGLNTDYYRFRGENTNIYYKGIGWGVALDLAPANGHGMTASIGYDRLTTEKIISDLNQLPINKKHAHRQRAMLGYQHKYGPHTLGIRLSEQYAHDTGIENIFGSALDNIYPQIGEERQYKHKQLDIHAGLLYQYRLHKALYEATYNQGYQNLKEKYEEPRRSLRSAAIISMLSLKGLWQTGNWQIQANLSAQYGWSVADDLQLTGQTNASLMPALDNYFAYLSHNRSTYTIGTEITYDTNRKYAVFLATQWQFAKYMHTQHTHHIHLTLGVKF